MYELSGSPVRMHVGGFIVQPMRRRRGVGPKPARMASWSAVVVYADDTWDHFGCFKDPRRAYAVAEELAARGVPWDRPAVFYNHDEDGICLRDELIAAMGADVEIEPPHVFDPDYDDADIPF